MKRFLLFMLTISILLLFVIPSTAAETTISGTYRIRSVIDYNWDKKMEDGAGLGPSHNHDLYTGYFDQRFQVKLVHKRSEFLKAVVVANIVEDTWGQGRSLRWNNYTGDNTGNTGWINTAYIEAITPIGLVRAGGNLEDKFGHGTWVDSGFMGKGVNDYGVTYGIKIDNFIAALTYIKYMDFVQPVLNNITGGTAPAGTFFRTWPGNAVDEIGGSGTTSYNADMDTYVLTAQYISDNVKAGLFFQIVLDPRSVASGLLVKGITDQPALPNGSTFAGESGSPGLLAVAPLGISVPGYGSVGPTASFFDAGAGELFVVPLWPTPASAFAGQNFGLDAISNVGYNLGLGTMGMYDVKAYTLASYVTLEFFDDRLQFKAEVDKIFGWAKINSYGRGYNAFLNDIQNMVPGIGVTPGPTTMGGAATWFMGTTLLPGQRVPEEIGIDSTNVYVDLSYHTDLFTVGAAFLYGSGEKWWHPFTKSHKALNTTGNDDFHWSNIVVSGDWNYFNSAAPLGLSNSEENVTSAKLYWSVRPFTSLDIHGAFVWAKYTEPVGRYAMDENLSLVPNWNAFYGHPMNYAYGNYATLPTAANPTGTSIIPAGVSDDLGWEIDFGITWTIMEGLTLNSEFGVLFTGDAFDYRNTETGEREDWGEIYRWVNTLTFEF
jgi:hypothetical protein